MLVVCRFYSSQSSSSTFTYMLVSTLVHEIWHNILYIRLVLFRVVSRQYEQALADGRWAESENFSNMTFDQLRSTMLFLFNTMEFGGEMQLMLPRLSQLCHNAQLIEYKWHQQLQQHQLYKQCTSYHQQYSSQSNVISLGNPECGNRENPKLVHAAE